MQANRKVQNVRSWIMKSDLALSPGEYVIFEVCFLDEELPGLIACLFTWKQQDDSACKGNFVFPELGRCISIAETQQRDYCNRNSHLLTDVCYTTEVCGQPGLWCIGDCFHQEQLCQCGICVSRWCRDSASLTSVSALTTPNLNQ